MTTRFSANTLTPSRVVDALARRIQGIPHFLSWKFGSESRANTARLKSFSGIHRGHRCFILGNGPSLRRTELSFLKNEITFGLNRIYLNFDEMGFQTTYYVSINELVLEQYHPAISKLTMPKFVNWNRRHLFDNQDNKICFIHLSMSLRDRFGLDPAVLLYSGGTVTFVALQLAYYMGFEEVILIGVDHSFLTTGTPNRTVVQTEVRDPNHFHPDYFPAGAKWQLPDLKRSEWAYGIARNTFEADGRQILDATINGKCPVFDKVEYKELFK